MNDLCPQNTSIATPHAHTLHPLGPLEKMLMKVCEGVCAKGAAARRRSSQLTVPTCANIKISIM